MGLCLAGFCGYDRSGGLADREGGLGRGWPWRCSVDDMEGSILGHGQSRKEARSGRVACPASALGTGLRLHLSLPGPGETWARPGMSLTWEGPSLVGAKAWGMGHGDRGL